MHKVELSVSEQFAGWKAGLPSDAPVIWFGLNAPSGAYLLAPAVGSGMEATFTGPTFTNRLLNPG